MEMVLASSHSIFPCSTNRSTGTSALTWTQTEGRNGGGLAPGYISSWYKGTKLVITVPWQLGEWPLSVHLSPLPSRTLVMSTATIISLTLMLPLVAFRHPLGILLHNCPCVSIHQYLCNSGYTSLEVKGCHQIVSLTSIIEYGHKAET